MPGRTMAETSRLWLREFSEEDADDYFVLGSDPRVVRYAGVAPLTTPAQALEVLRTRPLADYARRGFGRWACVLKDSGAFIGWAGLKYLEDSQEVDLGYWLRPAYWGQGLATEAAGGSVRFGLEQLKLDRIVARVDPENVRSARVLQKVGLQLLGDCQYDGKLWHHYAIGSADFHFA